MADVGSIIMLNLKHHMNRKLVGEERVWEEEMNKTKRSLDLQGQFFKNAVMMGDTQTIEKNRQAFESSFGKDNVQLAMDRASFLQQLIGANLYDPVEYQKESAEAKQEEIMEQEGPAADVQDPEEAPAVTPEDFTDEERVSHMEQMGPARFKTELPVEPSAEIGRKIPRRFEVTGFNMSPSGLSMTIKKNQQGIDAQFYQYFQEGMGNQDYADLSPSERNDAVFGDYLAKYGAFPSSEAMKRAGFTEREAVNDGMFHRLKEAKKNNPEFARAIRQAFPNLSGASLQTAVNIAAVRTTGNDMNYMPKDVRERLENMQAPVLSPELKQELSLMNIDPALASARERNLAMQRVNVRDMIQSGQVAAERERQVFGVKENQPVSDKVATSLNVPLGTTLKQAVDMKLTPKTKKVQDAIESAKSALKIVESLKKLSEQIHTGGRGGFARIASGGKRKAQAVWDDASAPAVYIKLREGYLALLTRAFGEKGPLREEDVQRIRLILPTLFASKAGAAKHWEEIEAVMSYRITAAEGAVAPYRQKTLERPENSGKSVGRYNPDTDKMEYYKD